MLKDTLGGNRCRKQQEYFELFLSHAVMNVTVNTICHEW